MILDPPPASSSSEMFDFDPHHQPRGGATTTNHEEEQAVVCKAAVHYSSARRGTPGHFSCKPSSVRAMRNAHINATLLSVDFDKIWLFHINPARH